MYKYIYVCIFIYEQGGRDENFGFLVMYKQY